jgi:hypothetical protein
MGIPLVALSGQQQPGPIDQMGKAMELKSLLGGQQVQQQQIQAGQQENQMRSLQLQDQQTLRSLSPKYVQKDSQGNVTGYNLDGLVSDASSKGVSPQTLQALQLSHAQAVKGLADADKATLDNEATKNKMAYEVLEGIRGQADPVAKQAAYQQGVQTLQKAGVDTSKFPPTVPNDSMLDSFEAGIGQHAQQIDDAKKVADINKSKTDAFKEVPGTGMFFNPVTGESKMSAAGQTLTPAMMENKYVSIQEAMRLQQPVSPQDKAFVQSYEKMKTLVPIMNFNMQNQGATGKPGQPSQIAQGIADGSIKWQDVISARTPMSVKQSLLQEVKGINPQFNSGDFSIEQAVKKQFTSGDAAKNLTAFNTAIEHANQLGQAADALNNGNMPTLNKIGNALGYQFGSDKMTNFNVIKNALAGEISKVFKGGQATDAEIKAVEEPFSSANSPAQLKGAINNAVKLMNSKRDALQQQYQQGVNAKPNFGGGAKDQVSVTDPRGVTHVFPDQKSADNFKQAAGIK